jgi:hypothetical protein
MRKSTTVHFLYRIDLFLHSVPPLSPCSEKHTEELQHPPKSSRLWQMDRFDAWILHRLWPLCCRGFCVVLFPNSTTTRRLHRNFYFSIFNHKLCLFVFYFISSILTGCGAAYCEGRDTLENLCSMIPGDAQQYSLFRRDAAPVECPFRGSYTFTYSRGHGECRSPVSRLDSCTESWRTFFRYQACPDVQGTESSGKMKASTSFVELNWLQSRFPLIHSWDERLVQPFVPAAEEGRKFSRSWNFHSAQCPRVLGLPVFFNYWLEQEGTKRRRPTNLFWIDGLWRCMYGGFCRAFESFMFVWLWPKLTCVCLWE